MQAGTGLEAAQILIVEDDSGVSDTVSAVLETAGYTPITVESAAAALETLDQTAPALVLLDINLPDMDGLQLLRQVRETSQIPLIVLSGFKGGQERISAFEAGADGYMAKPFAPDELIARIGALLRRVEWTPPPEPKMIVRHLELDMARRQATIRGRKLHLTPIEYGILVTLMRHAGQIITHDELLHAVWGDTYKGDYSVLRVNISRLRQKLEESPRRPLYIVTIPGQGYTLPIPRL